MESLLLALLGVFGGGFLTMLGAVAMGGLVPSSRVEAERKEKEKALLAASIHEKNYLDQKAMIDRASLTTDVTNKVMEAMRAMFQGTPPNPTSGGHV